MTTYFVVTALTTVRPASPWTHRVDIAALTIAVGLALIDFVTGVKAFNSPRGLLNGVRSRCSSSSPRSRPPGVGDARVMRSGMPRGGAPGAPSLAVCFALFIAAGRSSRSVRASPGSCPSRYDRTDAHAADPARVRRDVLLVVEGAPSPTVAGDLRHEALPQSAPASAPTPMRPAFRSKSCASIAHSRKVRAGGLLFHVLSSDERRCERGRPGIEQHVHHRERSVQLPSRRVGSSS